MDKKLISENVQVMDRGYLQYGIGKITNVKKTCFDVNFGYPTGVIPYDYPHAQFLDIVDDDGKVL